MTYNHGHTQRDAKENPVTEPMPTINDLLDACGGPKMLRETVCVAQTDLDRERGDAVAHRARLDALVTVLDICRPLDHDGRHGDLHTDLCGC